MQLIASNDDWSSDARSTIETTASRVGAFPFQANSRDAAPMVDLAAGAYKCIISGDVGTSGEVLLEVYRVPR